MSIYADRINAATTLEELENIVEDAADNMNITNEDYCQVYACCVNRAQTMGM